MKRIFITLPMLFCLGGSVFSQYTYTIKADTVKITSNTDSAELFLQNHTQGVPGFLYNNGNGRTIFKRAILKLDDTTYLLGADTLRVFPVGTARTQFQALENQRLSTTNSPNFAGLTVNGATVWNSLNLDTTKIPFAGAVGEPARTLFSSLYYKSALWSLYDTSIASGDRPGTSGSPWWNLINVRHRNGAGDGVNYGLQIANEMSDTSSLYFRNESAAAWTPWNTIWHSGNVTQGTGIGISGTTISNTGVTSFNTRTGAVTLASSDVTSALGYTPLNPTALQYQKFLDIFAPSHTGATSLFFTSGSFSTFVVTEVAVVNLSASSSFTFSIGTNSTSFNNVISSTSVSLSTVNTVTTIRPTSYIVIPASTTVDINVTVAGSGSPAVRIFVTGYYTGN